MFPNALLLIPALVVAPPQAVPLARAVEQLLDEYDLTGRFRWTPTVSRKDRPALAWLRGALDPASTQPFSKGHRSQPEAEALLALMAGETVPAAAPSLREPGSQLRYWRWGAGLVRKGQWTAEVRRRWENQLLAAQIHPVLRGLALRHALCFALAEQDEARFTELKARVEPEGAELVLPFQTALGLQGAFAPSLRLWSLPDLAPVSVSLAQRGIRRVRVAQVRGEPTPPLGADTLWIIPTREGEAPSDIDQLDEATRTEAAVLLPRLPKDTARIFLAPVRGVLMQYGLLFFPIELELDSEGRIQRIRMGDAALAAPSSL